MYRHHLLTQKKDTNNRYQRTILVSFSSFLYLLVSEGGQVEVILDRGHEYNLLLEVCQHKKVG